MTRETQDTALPQTEETGETYAVVIHNRLPHCLFDDMDTAIEYVESHPRLSQEDGSTQVMWPLRARRLIDGDE